MTFAEELDREMVERAERIARIATLPTGRERELARLQYGLNEARSLGCPEYLKARLKELGYPPEIVK